MSDITVLYLNNYVKPKLEENKAKNWVLNGPNNSFYQYVIDRNNGSVTNAAINKSYSDLIYGKGLSAKDAHLKTLQWAEFVSMLKPKELKKIIADFQIFGEAAIQVIKQKGNKEKVARITHLAKQLVVPALENEDGEIEGYWYSKNWSKTSQNPPDYFPAFGTSKEAIEVYVIKPYAPGCNYFALPDYMAGLQYAEMEEEISNFCIKSIKQGLSAGYIINFPDGQGLSDEEKKQFEAKVKQKLTGSGNAQQFVISFQDKDAEITVVPFPVNEQQHKQWDFLTQESRQQIMTAHRVVSPMLFGIKDSTGLGNNADELDTAEAQLVKRVIAPKQQYILDALSEIIQANGITLDLYFRPLTEVSAVSMSAQPEKKNLDETVADELILLGEDDPDEDWELISTEMLTADNIELALATTGTAIPNAKSELDGKQFKTRLRYMGEVSSNTREFCRKMITAGKIYRIEDIQRMSLTAVNPGWGPEGANTYDILLYKGGGNCKHYWQKETYQLKADVNSPRADTISPAAAKKAGEEVPKIDSKAHQKPADMPNNGFLNK